MEVGDPLSSSSLGLGGTSTRYLRRAKGHKVKADHSNIEGQSRDRVGGSVEGRQTYDLKVLKLMNEIEYEAWLKATENMGESDKMLAIQRLYPMADPDKIGRSVVSVNSGQGGASLSTVNRGSSLTLDHNRINGLKEFNSQSDFAQRYKNVYAKLNLKLRLDGGDRV